MEYKGYMIVSDGAYGLKEIRHTGKGSMPTALKGSFTHASLAQKAIDRYLQDKQPKGE